jgi:hypothetical protein
MIRTIIKKDYVIKFCNKNKTREKQRNILIKIMIAEIKSMMN